MAKIFIASDHRGFQAKAELFSYLSAHSHEISDLGPSTYDQSDDYNDSAIAVSKAVLATPGSFGIILCGSSVGVTIQANRFKGIRAASCFTPEIAQLARQHNDANILCLPADFLSSSQITSITDIFLSTDFLAEDRLIRRNSRLDQE